MKLIYSLLSIFLLGISWPAIAEGTDWSKSIIEYTQPLEITVYRSPSCGCCGDWLAHLEQHGFEITDIKTKDMKTVKEQHQVPPILASCHTAVIDGYVIEGHVPADDIKQLLLSRPDVQGLTVPAMPVGTPGMEMGGRKDPFAVVQFSKDGSYGIFNNYSNY